jgi:alkaline phosphatase
MTWDPKPVKADVFFGGGARAFCKGNANCATLNGKDYYAEYAALGYTVVKTQKELDSYTGTGPVVGIFTNKHMDTWLDRTVYPENLLGSKSSPDGTSDSATDQPGLQAMTMKAIEVMSGKCKDGFFLMAEAASVDKAMHGIDYDRALADLLELDRTVQAVVDWSAKADGETGIVVTADHSQAFDVFGSVDTEYFNKLPNQDLSVVISLL